MASFKQALRDIFGWGLSRPAFKTKGSIAAGIAGEPLYINQSLADRYNNEVNFRARSRKERYDDYDAMDEMSDVASVLDAYAEDATQVDYKNKRSVWIESDDKKITKECEYLLHTVLNVEDWIEGCARDTGKMGDDMACIKASDGEGITSLMWRAPADIERIENADGILMGFEEVARLPTYRQELQVSLQQGEDGSKVSTTYKPWDVIHFRIFKKKRLSGEKLPNIYGTSLLSGSERVAKQVKILDDMLMIMRLTRSLDKNMYKVDVGRSPVEEEIRILNSWKRALKRRIYVDPSTGRFDSRFDPQAWTEDEFWPVKEGSNSGVETRAGLSNISDIVDIDHFRDKFFGSLRAPKSYFGYEGDVNAKATLSSQSIKWARSVVSLQRAVRTGLKRLCQIHLAWKGIKTEAKDFEVMMTTPGLADLLDRLEAWQTVIDIAERMAGMSDTLGLNKKDWNTYILQNVFWFSKQDAMRFIKGMTVDETEDSEDGSSAPPPETPPKGSEDKEGEDRETETQDDQKDKDNGTKIKKEDIDEAIRSVASRMTSGAKPWELPPIKEN